jgi:hypothetical protein
MPPERDDAVLDLAFGDEDIFFEADALGAAEREQSPGQEERQEYEQGSIPHG